VPWGRLSP